MIDHPAFAVDAWQVREAGLHLDVLAQTESVFALSNGHIGMRGNFDEGEPYGLPGTYLNSVHELRPLPYAEAGYGYPESGQTVINVTNGKIIRLLVDDEPFDVRYGSVREHGRVLDLRDGVLRRRVRWTSPAGRTVTVSSTRMVSFTQRALCAIEYIVEPEEAALRVVVQSELVANEALPQGEKDPRVAAMLEAPLVVEEAVGMGQRGLLIHSTRHSRQRIGAAMYHDIDGPDGTVFDSQALDDIARTTITARIEPGQRLRIVKYVAYGWSSERSRPAIHDQVIGALSAGQHTGWEGLLAEQRSFLDNFWDRSDVEVEGDPEIQQAVRFALFHVLQAGARGERRPIPAKGLTGPGYDGHAFWDTETFVLPVLMHTLPGAVADCLRWRQSTIDLARQRARELGLAGAAFPWRTLTGPECSSYWPAGTAAFHINADIADAVVRYVAITGDEEFERETGVELLVETARLWRSLGHHDHGGRFRIDGVTGPDEYSAIADNNVYTNLMAQQNLRAAADVYARHPRHAARFGADAEEAASWRDAADSMLIPFDARLGVHPQAEGFTEHEIWHFDETKPEQYPMLLHFPYFDLYRKQVVKQADLVLAIQLQGHAFTAEQKVRDFAYYEMLTVRDSSLSASTQAVVAAECGQMQLAYDYLGEAALMDLDDIEHNTRDGVHIASLAGAWTALVAGFGGMRVTGGRLTFAPRLPEGLGRLTFRLMFRGRLLHVEVTPHAAQYSVRDGAELTISHHGEELVLSPAKTERRAIPPIVAGPRPTQPPGRAPAPRAARRA